MESLRPLLVLPVHEVSTDLSELASRLVSSDDDNDEQLEQVVLWKGCKENLLVADYPIRLFLTRVSDLLPDDTFTDSDFNSGKCLEKVHGCVLKHATVYPVAHANWITANACFFFVVLHRFSSSAAVSEIQRRLPVAVTSSLIPCRYLFLRMDDHENNDKMLRSLLSTAARYMRQWYMNVLQSFAKTRVLEKHMAMAKTILRSSVSEGKAESDARDDNDTERRVATAGIPSVGLTLTPGTGITTVNTPIARQLICDVIAEQDTGSTNELSAESLVVQVVKNGDRYYHVVHGPKSTDIRKISNEIDNLGKNTDYTDVIYEASYAIYDPRRIHAHAWTLTRDAMDETVPAEHRYSYKTKLIFNFAPRFPILLSLRQPGATFVIPLVDLSRGFHIPAEIPYTSRAYWAGVANHVHPTIASLIIAPFAIFPPEKRAYVFALAKKNSSVDGDKLIVAFQLTDPENGNAAALMFLASGQNLSNPRTIDKAIQGSTTPDFTKRFKEGGPGMKEFTEAICGLLTGEYICHWVEVHDRRFRQAQAETVHSTLYDYTQIMSLHEIMGTPITLREPRAVYWPIDFPSATDVELQNVMCSLIARRPTFVDAVRQEFTHCHGLVLHDSVFLIVYHQPIAVWEGGYTGARTNVVAAASVPVYASNFLQLELPHSTRDGRSRILINSDLPIGLYSVMRSMFLRAEFIEDVATILGHGSSATGCSVIYTSQSNNMKRERPLFALLFASHLVFSQGYMARGASLLRLQCDAQDGTNIGRDSVFVDQKYSLLDLKEALVKYAPQLGGADSNNSNVNFPPILGIVGETVAPTQDATVPGLDMLRVHQFLKAAFAALSPKKQAAFTIIATQPGLPTFVLKEAAFKSAYDEATSFGLHPSILLLASAMASSDISFDRLVQEQATDRDFQYLYRLKGLGNLINFLMDATMQRFSIVSQVSVTEEGRAAAYKTAVRDLKPGKTFERAIMLFARQQMVKELLESNKRTDDKISATNLQHMQGVRDILDQFKGVAFALGSVLSEITKATVNVDEARRDINDKVAASTSNVLQRLQGVLDALPDPKASAAVQAQIQRSVAEIAANLPALQQQAEMQVDVAQVQQLPPPPPAELSEQSTDRIAQKVTSILTPQIQNVNALGTEANAGLQKIYDEVREGNSVASESNTGLRQLYTDVQNGLVSVNNLLLDLGKNMTNLARDAGAEQKDMWMQYILNLRNIVMVPGTVVPDPRIYRKDHEAPNPLELAAYLAYVSKEESYYELFATVASEATALVDPVRYSLVYVAAELVTVATIMGFKISASTPIAGQFVDFYPLGINPRNATRETGPPPVVIRYLPPGLEMGTDAKWALYLSVNLIDATEAVVSDGKVSVRTLEEKTALIDNLSRYRLARQTSYRQFVNYARMAAVADQEPSFERVDPKRTKRDLGSDISKRQDAIGPPPKDTESDRFSQRKPVIVRRDDGPFGRPGQSPETSSSSSSSPPVQPAVSSSTPNTNDAMDTGQLSGDNDDDNDNMAESNS